jgi:hypothetical protein
VDSPNAPQHNDFRHISSMNNRSGFNREKISFGPLARKNRALIVASMAEKTQAEEKLLKTIVTHREH